MIATCGTYVIWGPPGTGKTTHLAQRTRAYVQWARSKMPDHRTPVLLCSLTRTAAAEIAGRDLPLPRECIGTLHAHAYRALGRPPVAEAHAADFNQAHPSYRLSAVEDDIDEPDWEHRPVTTGDELAAEYHLLRARMIDRRLWKPRVQAFARAWESWKADTGCVDFTDMIERAHQEVPFAPGAPRIIIADEAQDLSALEFELLERWGRGAGNLVITGDPYQALYVWRGARPEVFLSSDVPSDHRRVLAQSYRVPRAVHEAAMRWVRQLSTFQEIEYRPRDCDGELTCCPATWSNPEPAIDLAAGHLDAGRSVMICASCSYFLTPTLNTLRRRGIPFANPWRTKRGDWNPLGNGRGVSMAQRLTDFLRHDLPSFGDDARPWTVNELARWTDPLAAKGLLTRGAKKQIADAPAEFRDEPAGFAQLVEWFEPGPFNELVNLIGEREFAATMGEGPIPPIRSLLSWWSTRLLATKRKAAAFPLTVAERRGAAGLIEPPRLSVGTIHSFKGAEADVVILLPDLSPSGLRQWHRAGAGRDSVVRLFYVGITRARETLAICRPGSSQKVSLDWLVN